MEGSEDERPNATRLQHRDHNGQPIVLSQVVTRFPQFRHSRRRMIRPPRRARV